MNEFLVLIQSGNFKFFKTEKTDCVIQEISALINQGRVSVSAGFVVYNATITGDGCSALFPIFTNIGKTN